MRFLRINELNQRRREKEKDRERLKYDGIEFVSDPTTNRRGGHNEF